jgi:hypothetical protein
MKTKITKRMKQAASALITALVICSIFSLFVVYYLSFIEQQNYLNARSQSWNVAISITEAGVEEGLEHLNDNTANLGLAPWTYLGGTTYYRSNTLPDGNSYTVFITNSTPNPVVVARAYVASSSFITLSKNISAGFFAAAGVNPTPIVVTRAVQVNCSRTSLFLAPLVAKKNINLNGNNVTTDSFNSCDPTKSVNGQYAAWLAGDHGDIASNLGVIDSISGGNANVYGTAHTGTNYSGQPTVSIGPNGAVGSHAWQASNKGLQPGWVLEDANFTFPDTTFPSTSGYMTPTGGVMVIRSNYVSSTAMSSATYPAGSGIGGVNTNLSYTTSATYPSPVVPGVTTNYLTSWVDKSPIYPAPGTYVGTVTVSNGGSRYSYYQIMGIASYNVPTYTFSYTLYNTNVIYSTNTYNNILYGSTDLSRTNCYIANSLSGQTVVVGDNVILALPNGLSMSGNDSISILPFANVLGSSSTAPAGATIQVYSGGTSCTIGGNGVFNQPGYASDFILYCAPTVTTFTLNGNGGFNGVLVAPSVDLTFNGGGTTPIDFVGAAMVNSATLNGHFNFHYDECLANYKNNPRYLITGWNEIP